MSKRLDKRILITYICSVFIIEFLVWPGASGEALGFYHRLG